MYSSVSGHLATRFNTAVDIHDKFGVNLFSFFLDIYLGVELEDHLVSLSLGFEVLPSSFQVAVPFSVPISNVWECQFLHILVCFFLLGCLLCSYLRNHLPNQVGSKSFMFLALTFRPLIHFEFIFVCGVR